MTDRRLVESWAWFSFVCLTVFCRYVSRAIRLGGWRYFELEDMLMVLAFGFYTNLTIWVNVQEKHPHTNILPPTGTAGMTDAEINDRVYGSKITFVIEESMVMTQFLCKICMCLLYFKLTSGLKKQVQVKALMGYVVLGWLVTEIFFFSIWCRPFVNYFRVFDDNDPQCETSQKHLIMSYFFNISSDVLMLAVPVPYYCFAHPESILWIFWYVREASTAVIVANVPHLYALLRKVFDLGAFGGLVKRTAKRTRYMKHASTSVELNQRQQSDRRMRSENDRSESTENFAHREALPLQMWQRNEYTVDGNDAREMQLDGAKAQSLWRGALGTKSTVVGSTS
ncbi:hypothetical protein TOPH_07866 [Tolypocladium ophioglossoides CBS 100239]|uniref:Rhodopsin domain-containing protein n=1 Tax=Tolypocladium ophioglossoides (strain CBS 100239) TaxID=1163406 RepID=A0A0L0N0C5_TOLOC|nr:hypothetical protein TOPH_07866 [Tolypocladium ophioglossoides CBS 100239]